MEYNTVRPLELESAPSSTPQSVLAENDLPNSRSSTGMDLPAPISRGSESMDYILDEEHVIQSHSMNESEVRHDGVELETDRHPQHIEILCLQPEMQLPPADQSKRYSSKILTPDTHHTDHIKQFQADVFAIPDVILPVVRSNSTENITDDEPAISVVKEVVYTWQLALVAQWNTARRAVDWSLGAAWDLFMWGYLTGVAEGQRMANPEARAPTGTSHGSLNDFDTIKFIKANLGHKVVRSFAGVERRLQMSDYFDFTIHSACTNVACQHVRYDVTEGNQFQYHSTCSECGAAANQRDNVGLVPYPRKTLLSELERFFSVKGMEKLC